MSKKSSSAANESGVPDNNILNDALFYKSALQYAQMRAESVNGLGHCHVPRAVALRSSVLPGCVADSMAADMACVCCCCCCCRVRVHKGMWMYLLNLQWPGDD